MSQNLTASQGPTSSQRCGGAKPMTEKETKGAIKNLKQNKNAFSEILDISSRFYESRLAPLIRDGLRKFDTEPLTDDALYAKKCGELLCDAGDYSQFFHYSSSTLSEKTVFIRYELREAFPDLLPSKRLGHMAENDQGEQLYLPDYAEIDRLIGGMVTLERGRMLTTEV